LTGPHQTSLEEDGSSTIRLSAGQRWGISGDTLRRTAGLVAGRGSEGAGRCDGRAALVDEGIFVQGGDGGIVLDVDVVIVDVCLVMQLLRR
jgi:hypothetical protein